MTTDIPLYTTKRVAEICKCCTDTIWRHSKRLKLGTIIGREKLFTEKELGKLRRAVNPMGNPTWVKRKRKRKVPKKEEMNDG